MADVSDPWGFNADPDQLLPEDQTAHNTPAPPSQRTNPLTIDPATGKDNYGGIRGVKVVGGVPVHSDTGLPFTAQETQSSLHAPTSRPIDTYALHADGTTPSAPPLGSPDNVLDVLRRNQARIESGGNYGITGPVTKDKYGVPHQPYGKYQVMDYNVGPWTKELLGKEMTPQEFLSDPQAQEAVYTGKMKQYLAQTGNPQYAASMWFTGQPLAKGANRKDILGTSGAQYAAAATEGAPGLSSGGGSGSNPLAMASSEEPSSSSAVNGAGQDLSKLWKVSLLMSLFPQHAFTPVAYDPFKIWGLGATQPQGQQQG